MLQDAIAITVKTVGSAGAAGSHRSTPNRRRIAWDSGARLRPSSQRRSNEMEGQEVGAYFADRSSYLSCP